VTALFRRLNLRSLHCEEFTILTHIKISSNLANRIIAAYRGRVTPNTPRSAVYGTTYTVNKIPHAVRVDVREEGKVYHVEFTYEEQKRPKPPKRIKSPQLLIDFLNEEPQDIELACFADFAYKQDEWQLLIEVPMAIVSDKESKEPFTHIEGIEFSRREESHVQYSVEIGKLENGTILHSTYFNEPWKGKLTQEIPTLLLKRSSSLSRLLVRRKKRSKHGS
jgi:hypothetical protein